MAPSDGVLDDEELAFLHSVGELRKLRRQSKAENHLDRFRADRKHAEELIWDYWRDAFDSFDLALDYAFELGKEFNHALRPQAVKDGDPLIDVLTRLQCRACQVASEVRSLLITGHAMGAMARWRTLHELAVTALFIEQGGAEVAHRYWQHGDIETRRLIRAWNHPRASHGLGVMEPEITAELEEIASALNELWGADFRNSYGWASTALVPSNPNPKFDHLEAAVGYEGERWRYKLASIGVHSQVWGLRFNLGLPLDEEGVLACGPITGGFSEPAAATLLALYRCSAAMVLGHPDDEWLIRVRALFRLCEESAGIFASLEHEHA